MLRTPLGSVLIFFKIDYNSRMPPPPNPSFFPLPFCTLLYLLLFLRGKRIQKLTPRLVP